MVAAICGAFFHKSVREVDDHVSGYVQEKRKESKDDDE